jgi:hypothetical protein
MGEVGCSLDSTHQSFGSRSDSPLTEEVIVFSRIRDGNVQDLRVYGESCPIEAKGARITWIGSIDTDAGLDWLENVARLDEHSAALYAIALYRSAKAARRLYSLAKDTGSDVSEEATFWLGQKYPQRAQDWLLEVINTEQDEDVLEQAVFAISQLPGEAGDMMLLDLAKSNQTPRAVRRQALFWLAQSDNDDSIAALTELLTR